MSLVGALEKAGQTTAFSVPELRYLRAAAQRVRERWPDVQVPVSEQEREALAQKLREHVEEKNWRQTHLSFIIVAASAVFDPERRERSDLASTRDFLYAEIAVSTSETFLSGLLRTYLDCYISESLHTVALGEALSNSLLRMSPSERILLNAIPEFLDAASGPENLAVRMSKMSDPFTKLVSLGVRNPHGTGFMDIAHLSLTNLIRPHLSERGLIDWYIRWLRPLGKEDARATGSETAIEALLHPWLDKTPDDKLRSFLVETLIEFYGDPRIKSGGVWAGIESCYLAIVYRWLTREDMRFFTGVVDAVQKNDMWAKRRDFWLKLYDEGKIDAAWAALSAEGFEYARQNLMRQDAKNAYTRVGFQRARQNTSLLIMKIGNKIIVDGCHSYRTHVFDAADPLAPKLYEEGYDCEQIMYASDERMTVASKSHSSINSWSRWVRDMINADVAFSKRTRPYTKVSRPRSNKPRYTPQRQKILATYDDRRTENNVRSRSVFVQSEFSQEKSAALQVQKRPSGRVISDVALSSKFVDSSHVKPAPSDREHPSSVDSVTLKQKRFLNLTDRMVAYGAEAPKALLAYLETLDSGQERPMLSPKAREALVWTSVVKGDLPLHLRNSLEYLLLNLKRGGVDLDNLFATTSEQFKSFSTSSLNSSMHGDPAEKVRSSQQKIAKIKSFDQVPENSNLTDLMTLHGSEAASAVLNFLMKSADKSLQRRLSLKSREGLEWVIAQKGELPTPLWNALEHLLIGLKRDGYDLDALLATSTFETDTLSEDFPPLPNLVGDRINFLKGHVTALEDLGSWQKMFEQRRDLAIAVRKLKNDTSDLLETEIEELEKLYEQLRQGKKDKGR